MNVLKSIEEIGFLQAGLNIVEVFSSYEVAERVGAVMPLPPGNLPENVKKMAAWLTALKKSKIMFLTPEIALFDQIPKYMDDVEGIIVVPNDMDGEMKDRLGNNLPLNMKVSLRGESDFPEDFIPKNGVIVACGYIAGDHLMVLPSTYRLIEHYRDFLGKVVFLPYTISELPIKYPGWIEIGADRFSLIWRDIE